MRLRIAQLSDRQQMQHLYVDTIHAVCCHDYNDEQRAVWTSTADNVERWNSMIRNQLVIIAEKNNKLVGYGTLDSDYIDFFYVHKDYQRQGIACNILAQIETQARKSGHMVLSSDVSITAKPFFEKKGYKVLKEQKNFRKGVELINYRMEKVL